MEERRDFIKKLCAGGLCLCGFASLPQAVKAMQTPVAPAEDSGKALMKDWISTLMKSLDDQSSEEQARVIMKACAVSHYNQLKMDDVLAPYVGNLPEFCIFLQKEWGWKIKNDVSGRVLVADEGKSYCVCPMVDSAKGVRSAVLCYCSEGFAEKMFSKVCNAPVRARVLASIHRGDSSCRYEIRY